MKVGEERTFPMKMPDDWPQEFIRGEAADNGFNVFGRSFITFIIHYPNG